MREWLLICCLLTSCAMASAESIESRNFTKTSENDLQKLESLHLEALAFEQNREFPRAIQIYLEILLIEPDDDEAYASLGRDYLTLGDRTRSKDAFENALHINPDNEIALVGLQKIRDPDR